VDLEADAVTGAVAEMVAEPGLDQDLTDPAVELATWQRLFGQGPEASCWARKRAS